MVAQRASVPSEREGWTKDYYEVLRLQSGADAAAVEQAYWYLARRYSAAQRTDPDAKGQLDELNEAYGVLGSPILRREYDFRRNGGVEPEDLDPDQPRPALASIRAIAADRARWREGTHAAATTATPSLPNIDLPELQALPWRRIVSGIVVVALGAVAMMAGAHTGLVLALIVLGLVFVGMPVPSDDESEPLEQPEAPVPGRQAARPDNLGEVLIPRGTTRGARRIVYQVYEQCPHLGPADVRAVTRYAVLTQRFLDCERRLTKNETGEPSDEEELAAAGEQRALAGELRLHEAALGITSNTRAPHRASPAPAAVHDEEPVDEDVLEEATLEDEVG
jgi:hypothetical protein